MVTEYSSMHLSLCELDNLCASENVSYKEKSYIGRGTEQMI